MWFTYGGRNREVLEKLVQAFNAAQDRYYVRDKRIGVVLLAWACFTLALGFASPFIDNGAHLGGGAVGLACGLIVPSRLLEAAAARGRR